MIRVSSTSSGRESWSSGEWKTSTRMDPREYIGSICGGDRERPVFCCCAKLRASRLPLVVHPSFFEREKNVKADDVRSDRPRSFARNPPGPHCGRVPSDGSAEHVAARDRLAVSG